VQSGAKSVNGVGTCLIGKIETTDFPVITKWLCFFYFPILPVRSFYVLGQPDLVIEPGEFVTSYNLVPFSGVGLYWPSIGLSLRWTVGFLLIAAAVYFFSCDPDPASKRWAIVRRKRPILFSIHPLIGKCWKN
jgi:hypothetical protein